MSAPTAPWGSADGRIGLDRELRYAELTEVLDRFAKPGPVLELGSGPGGLGPRTSNAVVAVDLKRFDGISVQADGRFLPFRDGAFRSSVCVDVLEHVPGALRAPLLAELRRVTSDLVVVGGPMGPAARQVDEQLSEWHGRHGHGRPDWLEEHLDVGEYPMSEEIDEAVGTAPLATVRGISCRNHRILTMAQSVRGGSRLGEVVVRRTGANQRIRSLAASGRTPYRSLRVYDLAPVRFSVVMATRNRAERLGGAIDAVLAQTDGDLELIVVDDGSTDSTSAVVEGIAARDGRVRLFRNPAASGTGMARNSGLRHARGAYLAFCDDDVRWQPTHLAVCREVLDSEAACYTQAARFLPDGRFYDTVGRAPGPSGLEVGDVDANTIAVRREVMRPFPDGRGRYASEDVALMQELWRSGVRPLFVPQTTVDYIFSLDSQCYQYSIEDGEDGVVVTAKPLVKGAKAWRGRIGEALSVRVRRISRRVSASLRRSARAA